MVLFGMLRVMDIEWFQVVVPAVVTGIAAIIAGWAGAARQARNDRAMWSEERAARREERFLDIRRETYMALLLARDRLQRTDAALDEARAEARRLEVKHLGEFDSGSGGAAAGTQDEPTPRVLRSLQYSYGRLVDGAKRTEEMREAQRRIRDLNDGDSRIVELLAAYEREGAALVANQDARDEYVQLLYQVSLIAPRAIRGLASTAAGDFSSETWEDLLKEMRRDLGV